MRTEQGGPSLFRKRKRERIHVCHTYNLQRAVLSIPETQRGKVSLRFLLSRDDFDLVRLEPIAFEWEKGSSVPSIPPPGEIAEVAWKAITTATPDYPRRRPGFAKWRIPTIGRWRVTVLLHTDQRNLLRFLPKQLTEEQIREAFNWATNLLLKDDPGVLRHWPRDPDPLAWIYRAHLWTAMFVADEIAGLLLRNDPNLMRVFRQWEEQERILQTDERFRQPAIERVPRETLARVESAATLLEARGTLEARARESFSSDHVTQRRLAMALVDAKFFELYPTGLLARRTDTDRELMSLLDCRRAGLDDGTAWSKKFPREKKQRLQKLLRPGKTVFDVWLWPKRRREKHRPHLPTKEQHLPAASVFSAWFGEFLHDPLRPMFPPPRTDEEPRRLPQILDIPYAEYWAALLY